MQFLGIAFSATTRLHIWTCTSIVNKLRSGFRQMARTGEDGTPKK